MDKKTLSERDVCTKYITPALEKAGWNKQKQILEEVSFTAWNTSFLIGSSITNQLNES